MRLFNILVICCLLTSASRSQRELNLCDSLKLFFHGKESCYSKENEVYKCGLILTQRNISPALYFYHYNLQKKEWVLLNQSVYYPQNINFVNNLECELKKNSLMLTFYKKNGKQEFRKFRLTKKFNFSKKLKQIEDSLKAELLQFED